MSSAEIIELEKQVLVQKYELEIQQLKNEADEGKVGDINWLKEATSINSTNKLKETVLYPFRSELEGDIVFYPSSKGKPWKIHKSAFKEWMKKNFKRVNW